MAPLLPHSWPLQTSGPWQETDRVSPWGSSRPGDGHVDTRSYPARDAAESPVPQPLRQTERARRRGRHCGGTHRPRPPPPTLTSTQDPRSPGHSRPHHRHPRVHRRAEPQAACTSQAAPPRPVLRQVTHCTAPPWQGSYGFRVRGGGPSWVGLRVKGTAPRPHGEAQPAVVVLRGAAWGRLGGLSSP